MFPRTSSPSPARRRLALALFAAALLTNGCWQKSLHPFYTDRDLIAEPKLAGVWVEAGSNDPGKWTFTATGEKSYHLVLEVDNETLTYDARPFEIEGRKFLDLYSNERHVSAIPAHNLFTIELAEPALVLRMLNPEWVREWLSENPADLSHIRVRDPEHPDDTDKDEIVLTADTRQLQRFLKAHGDKPEFFTKDRIELQRPDAPEQNAASGQ